MKGSGFAPFYLMSNVAKKKRDKTKVTNTKKSFSRTEQERGHIVAKKLLRHFDLDTELLNVFTKKQKQLLFSYTLETPSVKAEKDYTVPRPFMRMIHTELFRFMNTSFWGDPENQLSYMELATHGLAFFTVIMLRLKDGSYATGTPQEKAARLIADGFKTARFQEDAFKDVYIFLYSQIRGYSQVNFRLYGFHQEWESYKLQGFTRSRLNVYINAQICESKLFTHNNVERKAFRLLFPSDTNNKLVWATVSKNKIFPGVREDEELNIYIQSHALHRFKERMNMIEPKPRNLIIQHVLGERQHIVKTGKHTFISCTLNDNFTLGYFTFFVQGRDIVINTFIPLENVNTPEGKKLYELLHLSKEEMAYLGMDKLSFFFRIDFEQIPMLKQALIDSDIWKSKVAVSNIIMKNENHEEFIDRNQTQFVKSFFEKRELHLAEIVENRYHKNLLHHTSQERLHFRFCQ